MATKQTEEKTLVKEILSKAARKREKVSGVNDQQEHRHIVHVREEWSVMYLISATDEEDAQERVESGEGVEVSRELGDLRAHGVQIDGPFDVDDEDDDAEEEDVASPPAPPVAV